MTAPVSAIADNIERVRERIARAAQRCGRRPADIAVIAVSKTFPAAAIRAAYDAGLRAFGENRVQEFEAKSRALADLHDIVWHMIGHVQGNKARLAAHLFHRIDSVDSTALAKKLDDAAASEDKKLPVLIEVHLGDESTKSGVDESAAPQLANFLSTLTHVELRGLMTIPPFFDSPENARPYFRRLRELRDRLRSIPARPLPVLSMGMSHDFEVAIEEGATEIRVGSALFGDRPPAANAHE
jgi:PLP dependent protein